MKKGVSDMKKSKKQHKIKMSSKENFLREFEDVLINYRNLMLKKKLLVSKLL